MADETQTTPEAPQGKKSGLTHYTLAVIIILIAGYFILGSGAPKSGTEVTNEQPVPGASAPEMIVNPETPAPPAAPTADSSSPTETATVKTFNVSGKPFSFTPSEIKVKKGDTVKIIFANTGGTHDWVIDEFNARTPQIQSGETAEVTFVADKAGTFEYYCSVGEHRAQGMRGKLIVE